MKYKEAKANIIKNFRKDFQRKYTFEQIRESLGISAEETKKVLDQMIVEEILLQWNNDRTTIYGLKLD